MLRCFSIVYNNGTRVAHRDKLPRTKRSHGRRLLVTHTIQYVPTLHPGKLKMATPSNAQPEMWRDIITSCFRPVSGCWREGPPWGMTHQMLTCQAQCAQ